MDECNEEGHLDERAHNRCKSFTGLDTENRNRHGNGELEIIARGGECERVATLLIFTEHF